MEGVGEVTRPGSPNGNVIEDGNPRWAGTAIASAGCGEKPLPDVRNLLLSISLIACASLATSPLAAHGGTYKGPGDTVPPGGGGASTPTPPAAPGRPATPGSGSGPSTPNGPAPRNVPTPPSGPTQTGPPSASTPPGGMVQDLDTWQFWWEFNKGRFLNLRAKIHGGESVTDQGGGLTGLGGMASAPKTFAPTEQQIRTIVRPALLEAVQNEDDQDVLTGAMVALAKIGRDDDGKARELFREHLDAQVQEVRETAALCYGILKDESAIEDPLLPLMNDTPEGRKLVGGGEVDIRTRTFSAYGLALIGGYTKDEAVKMKVAEELHKTLLADDSSAQDLRVACVIGLGLLELDEPADIEKVVTWLSEYLTANQDDDIVLAHVPNSMAKLLEKLPPGDSAIYDKVLDQVIALLGRRSDAKVFTKQSAVLALGLLAREGGSRSQEIYDVLVEQAKKGKDLQLKNFTSISLAYLGSADPVFESEANRTPVTKFLLDNMRKSNNAYEQWCAVALGVMAFQLKDKGQPLPGGSTVPEAVHAKFNKVRSAGEKAAYALSLGLMGYEAAKADIKEAMDKNRATEFRGYAAIALGLLQAREYRDFLAQLIRDQRRDPDLLKQAAIGLGLMRDREVLDLLLEFLNPPDGRPTLAVLASTATAIGFIGDKRSVQPLVDALQNEKLTPLGRAFAAVALGMVGDKEYLPWNSPIGEDLNYRAAVATLTESNVSNGILDIL